MIIAIDGPAGSGKTTTARKVAKRLGIMHINTGAMYRGITFKLIEKKIDVSNISKINEILNNTLIKFSESYDNILFIDGINMSNKINSYHVTKNVSFISAIPEVRKKMVEFQRQMASGKNVVLEGRDIGTVVFPDAEYKFFLNADIDVRAERRRKDMQDEGENLSIQEIIDTLNDRDQKDACRLNSPLIKAKDAIELNTTNISIEEQVNFIINKVNNNQKGAFLL